MRVTVRVCERACVRGNVTAFACHSSAQALPCVSALNVVVVACLPWCCCRACARYDRLCFESNWFFSNWKPSPHWDEGYGTWLALLRQMLVDDVGASDADVRKVLRSNAVRVYGVDAPP
jgi:hypothetical protein